MVVLEGIAHDELYFWLQVGKLAGRLTKNRNHNAPLQIKTDKSNYPYLGNGVISKM